MAIGSMDIDELVLEEGGNVFALTALEERQFDEEDPNTLEVINKWVEGHEELQEPTKVSNRSQASPLPHLSSPQNITDPWSDLFDGLPSPPKITHRSADTADSHSACAWYTEPGLQHHAAGQGIGDLAAGKSTKSFPDCH